VPECEAERRIKMALHQMELDWGSGRFDYTGLRRMLDGPPCDCATRPDVGNIS